MIKIRNLFKSFENKIIIQNLSLDVKEGEKVAIIGPSGCGKSTVLKLILGLIKPDKGDIFIDNKPITRLTEKECCEVRKEVGLLFQSAALFDSLNVWGNVAFSLTENENNHSPKDIESLVKKILKMVEMEGFENQMPADLSGGQKRRIGIARTIANSPKLLLYDEPTAGLDPSLKRNIENTMNKLTSELKATSIVVTHQISTMLRTADKIYFLHNGNLLPAETPSSIKKSSHQIINTFFEGEF